MTVKPAFWIFGRRVGAEKEGAHYGDGTDLNGRVNEKSFIDYKYQ